MIMLKNQLQIHLKLLQKKLKKHQKQQMIVRAINVDKTAIKLNSGEIPEDLEKSFEIPKRSCLLRKEI